MVKLIKNDKQLKSALSRAYELMQKVSKAESPESDELEILALVIEKYEREHFPIPKPKPLEAIKFRLEQMNMSESQLSEILGYRSRKSEILSGKRKLSLEMIRKLNQVLHIPADVLIQAY